MSFSKQHILNPQNVSGKASQQARIPFWFFESCEIVLSWFVSTFLLSASRYCFSGRVAGIPSPPCFQQPQSLSTCCHSLCRFLTWPKAEAKAVRRSFKQNMISRVLRRLQSAVLSLHSIPSLDSSAKNILTI